MKFLIEFLKSLFGIKEQKEQAEKKETTETKTVVEPKPEKDFITKLREDLKRDEGVKYEIYLDHLGYPTFGIGHLVRNSDPEHGLPVGTNVSKSRVNEVFRKDIKTTIEDCERMFNDWDELPEELRLVLANMMFNLGYTNLSKFRNFRKAIKNRDYSTAADEMKDSLWYNQVTNRAERLRQRVLALA